MQVVQVPAVSSHSRHKGKAEILRPDKVTKLGIVLHRLEMQVELAMDDNLRFSNSLQLPN